MDPICKEKYRVLERVDAVDDGGQSVDFSLLASFPSKR
jgi:hypothetical protein